MDQEKLKETLSLIADARYLHEACQRLLEQFAIKYVPISPANLPVSAFLGAAFANNEHNRTLVGKIREVCVVGIATQDTFITGNVDDMSVDEFETNINNDKYQEMAFFSIDAREHMTRTEIATLTRAFNRRMVNRPVVLFVRSGGLLSLSTCERTDFVQSGHTGQRAGRVTILRDVDCSRPHRGHLEILATLDLSGCKSYDELYARWLDAFSNELLTRKFYAELSDWYAWAVQLAKFPNDLSTTDDDAKFNHESCIRLITRLIFVWFLKQKGLIPEEFFDEQYIRENLIADFDPHERRTLLYDAEQSKYYRLVLQNLFFAMLNCPIVAEGKTAPNNRRFRKAVTGYRLNTEYNINNLMRYEADFMPGGAEKFVKLANASVPFLNGGLFDCLDDKPRKLYYDGFSERRESLEQLHLPDYLFFGNEVGRSVDLSKWYDDKSKKSVSARGLIDILKRYSFTIEENTPLDQEVSLDPELLGKVFENLLASFNPETQTSARKQTGSFYTPREIVQYMVDESLVAHLKRMCGDDLEPQYRDLLSYSADEVDFSKRLSPEQCERIMRAVYDCRVLDPACGSGAFPMGMLQQMVHVLKRLDPTNQMWNKMMVDLTIDAARRELEKVAMGNEQERKKIAENREARLADIEIAFNSSVNDPDYARKLYLIEHCIYGVDIQPIATQISKLRFFISLVVDQKPTADAADNFGIRPLPNLEAKFVTANTLIPLDRNRTLFTDTDDIRRYEEQLRDLNHRIFLAKRNKDKQALRQQMMDTRSKMAKTLEDLAAIGSNGYAQLTEWNMFDQNASASFFDPEWMFGVKDGFDIVIGNPPYVPSKEISNSDKGVYKTLFSTAEKQFDMFSLFIEKGLALTAYMGVNSYIVPDALIGRSNFAKAREIILLDNTITKWVHLNKVFDNAVVASLVYVCQKVKNVPNYEFDYVKAEDVSNWVANKYNTISINSLVVKQDNEKKVYFANTATLKLREKLVAATTFGSQCVLWRGEEIGKKADFILQQQVSNCFPLITGKEARRYEPPIASQWIGKENVQKSIEKYSRTKIIIRQVGDCINATIDDNQGVTTQSVYALFPVNEKENRHLYALLGVMNSRLFDFFYRLVSGDKQLFKRIILENIKALPYPDMKSPLVARLDELVIQRYSVCEPELFNIERQIDHIVYHLYDLTYDEVLVIDPETPITREEYENYKETK